MGEVYRARDTKLNRDVAIKTLLPAVANDPDRLARFTHEAQFLASLSHPNIAAIYGLEESDGVKALVLEVVEGPTLAERIGARGLPASEAIAIARQIAEALDAAHEKGIVHRDLKPANVKVTPGGVVKVLDFGLAKHVVAAAQASQVETTFVHTRDGALLGTVGYMSPEQARGHEVDKRTDIWAFGCVLFELLSGRRAFEGATATDTLAAIVQSEPDWTVLPSDTPTAVQRLLQRCLAKDPRRRLRDIGEASTFFDEASDVSLTAPLTTNERARSHRSRSLCSRRRRPGSADRWLPSCGAPVRAVPTERLSLGAITPFTFDPGTDDRSEPQRRRAPHRLCLQSRRREQSGYLRPADDRWRGDSADRRRCRRSRARRVARRQSRCVPVGASPSRDLRGFRPWGHRAAHRSRWQDAALFARRPFRGLRNRNVVGAYRGHQRAKSLCRARHRWCFDPSGQQPRECGWTDVGA